MFKNVLRLSVVSAGVAIGYYTMFNFFSNDIEGMKNMIIYGSVYILSGLIMPIILKKSKTNEN